MTTDRAQRMIDSAPDYYQQSKVYAAIQQAIADELGGVSTSNDDVKKQLFIVRATWGLKYWEEALGIVTVESDSYEIRRSRVLAKWRGVGNFSADLVKSVCEAFTNGEVAVAFNVATSVVTVTFMGVRGIPPNLSDLQAQIENLVHAHLGLAWAFTYLIYDELRTSGHTYDQLKAHNLTYDQLKTWKPV